MSRIQNEDLKTLAQITGAGGTAAQLVNDTKIYVTANSLNKQLSQAIIDGDISGATSAVGVNLVTLDSSFLITKQTNANFEKTVGDWVAYADAAAVSPVDMTGGSPNTTIARTTSTPLDGAGSGLVTVTSSASRQGEGVSCVVNIPPAYRGMSLEFRFPFATTGTIVEDDFRLFAYDVTNSLLITPFTVQKVLGAAGFARAIVPVATNTASIRIGIHIARTSTGAATIKLDDVELSPQLSPLGMSGSDIYDDSANWTFSGFGTLAITSVWVKRVGDLMKVSGFIQTGTVAATTASINLPTNLRIDSNKFKTTSNAQKVGIWNFYQNSTNPFDGTSAGLAFYDGSDTTKLYMAVTTSASSPFTLAKSNGNALATTGNYVSFQFEIPIAGWSTNVSLGNSSQYLISSYLATGTRVTGAAPTLLGQYRSYIRNAAAFTITETNASPGTAPSVNDGIKIYNGNTFSSADANNEPAYYDIFIGKNKSYKILWYANAGRTGGFWTDPTWNSTTTTVGYFESYDPTTGILSLSANRALGATSTHASGYDQTQNAFVQDPFFDVLVSENVTAVGTQLPRSEVWVQSSNGKGSTNTVIGRYSNILANTGSAITYADSATLGGSFTINEPGIYAISLVFQKGSAGADAGISRNSTQLTTTIAGITASDRLVSASQYASSASYSVACSVTAILNPGDVIRMHTDSSAFGSNVAQDQLRIVKVSN